MGKSSILMVMGYSILMMASGMNMSNISVQAYDNSLGYYENAMVRNIAVAGANMAANYLFLYPPGQGGNAWWPGYGTEINFGGGQFRVTVDSTTSVDPLTGDRRMTVRSVATYRDSTYTVSIIMRPSNFAKFAVYAGPTATNVYWEQGDSAFGPVHTQGTLKVTGSPYFGGKVTVKNGVDSMSANPKGHPIFNAGLERGVSIPLNKSYQRLGSAAASNGKIFNTGTGDLYLTFKDDSVSYHRGASTVPDTTKYLPTFAPNGAISLSRGNIYVKGTVKGRYTIGALDSVTGSTSGRVIVTDDLRYYTDPRTTPSSTDMLGVVAWNDVCVAGDETKTSFTIQGSLFSYKMGVTVKNYSTRAGGIFYTYGGWVVEAIYATSGGSNGKGYKANIKFDERFRTSSPPFFPTTGTYEILAWYE